MDKLKSEELNIGATEYGLTGQPNTGSKLSKPPSDPSGDGLLAVRGKVESRKSKVESPEGRFLPIDLLRDGARELGIELTDAQLAQLDEFASLLVQTNRTLNLTRITEVSEIVTNHYLDSLTCLAAHRIAEGARVIDIGTGAGLPGIPIKIARPDLHLTLLDSSGKKLRFIEEAIARLTHCSGRPLSRPGERSGRPLSRPGGDGEPPLRVMLVHARAEDAGRDPAHREAYDVAVTRALADMKTLAELCLPLVKVGGVLIAQKSEDTGSEIDAARPLIGQLGGSIEKVARITLPYTDVTRRVVVIRKTKTTPPGFPRAYSRIAKHRRVK